MLLKSMSISETNAVSKILHISNMEIVSEYDQEIPQSQTADYLCQAIKILRPRHCCFYFDSQTEEKAKV